MVDINLYLDEIQECLGNIKSTSRPDEKSLRRLYDIYGKVFPRDKPCYTCPRDRGKVYNYFKNNIDKWLTNQ
jgi:hypothetical protein